MVITPSKIVASWGYERGLIWKLNHIELQVVFQLAMLEYQRLHLELFWKW
jgi:hypothetical protein